jgi:hypothetical protein
MPLTTNETKGLLVQMFRLTLATAQQRHEDAVAAFTSILDSTLATRFDLNTCCADISTIDGDSDDDMPPLVPLDAQHVPVQLIISETAPTPVVASASSAFTPIAQNVVVGAFNISGDIVGSDDEPASDEEEDEDAPSGDSAAASEAEEESDHDDEAEEVELNLEPVRIKKVMYWKDVNSGDIYTYIPEDEGVGDKVGTYVDGKPVFDA